MASIRHFVVLTVTLVALSAAAQPMLVVEHDWTFHVGNQQYGLHQSCIAPGGFQRHTTVYFGRPVFRVSMRAAPLLGVVVLPLGIVLTLALKQRSGR